MLSLRTLDDRGTPTRLPARFVWLAIVDWRQRWQPWTIRSAPKRLARIVFSGPFLATLGTVLIISLAIRIGLEDPATALWFLIFSPVYAPLITIVLITSRGAIGLGGSLPDLVRVAMLAQHRCPACGYDLASTPQSDDGCMVCAECGDAWDAHRMGAAARARPDVVVISDWSHAPLDLSRDQTERPTSP